MQPLAPFAFAAVTLVQTVPNDLAALKGYGPYRFGMTLEDIRKLTDLSEPKHAGDIVYYEGSDTTKIGDLRYGYQFQFSTGKLHEISLEVRLTIDDKQCAALFARTLYQVQNKYGRSFKTDMKRQGFLTKRFAYIPMKDVASVLVGSSASGNYCINSVTYTGPKEDNTF